MLQAAHLATLCPPELVVIVVSFAKGIRAHVTEGDRSLSADVAVMPRTFPFAYGGKRPHIIV